MNKFQAAKQVLRKSNPVENADKIDELYRPYLIHPTTYVILTEQILTLMPSERNVILTMNEYDLKEINPSHPTSPESPTHIIMFCIRFLSDGLFQPIGALMIYKYENQSKILAECVKAYINDLWKIGLYVVATVSPPFETFKSILSHLVEIENFNIFSGVISYSVAPFKEIIHVYDVQFLLIKLQNLFKESDIRFEEICQNDKRFYQASWADIAYILTSSKEFKLLSEYFMFNKEVSRRVHIFTEQIYGQLLGAEAQGNLSKHADGSLVLLSSIRTFLKFLEQDLVSVKETSEFHPWDGLIEILQTMQFQKSQCRTCTKETPFNKEHVLKNSTIRRRIDFENENQENKEAKPQTGKSKNRKKRKKIIKNNENLNSNKEDADDALPKMLSEDTSLSACFFNGFESERSLEENCCLDKNNNSSSDDSSNAKTTKISKKKLTLKNATCKKPDDEVNRLETSNSTLKYPRISLREFSRLSAEEENVLNNENLFNSSKQNILNNSENFKETPSGGGCLKKSITDILNSLNNVQFYSNLSAKNTNLENQNAKNGHKNSNLVNETVTTKDKATSCVDAEIDKTTNELSNDYLLNRKPKSYGSLEKSNALALCQELSELNLSGAGKTYGSTNHANSSLNNGSSCFSESNLNICDFKKFRFSKSEPKSNFSGSDLSNPNLNDLNVLESKQRETDKKLKKSNSSSSDSSQVDLSVSNDLNGSSNSWCNNEVQWNNPILNGNKNLIFNFRPESTDYKTPNLTEKNTNKETETSKMNNSVLSSSNVSSSFDQNTQNMSSSFDHNKPNPISFCGNKEDDTRKLNNSVSSSSNFGSSFDQNRPNSSSFCDTLDFSNDHFCSKSDEETEKSIKASCDNVPNILELLSSVEQSPSNIDNTDFETNAVTFELLCTVRGVKRLFKLLHQKRVREAKPDAFIVEHIDFLVTIIKQKNKIKSAAYYGNSYSLFNAELAISTLQSNIGLYLVSKE